MTIEEHSHKNNVDYAITHCWLGCWHTGCPACGDVFKGTFAGMFAFFTRHRKQKCERRNVIIDLDTGKITTPSSRS